MKFINRENELKTLSEEYIRDSSFVVIYGRRRTGKTTLIKEFIKVKNAIYFLSDTQGEYFQINRFKKILSEFYNDDLLEKVDIKDWDTFFEYFIKKMDNKKKLIIVVDEFQYLCKENKNFPSIFQRIWDEKLKQKNIMLILCGSLLGMMYETVLNYKSPLYGRRTAQINLKQMDFYHYKDFFNKNYNLVNLIEHFAVTGGIPKYIEFFNNDTGSLIGKIKSNILNKNSFLYAEPRFLLKEEINEISTYFTILQIIAGGEHKIGSIASKLNLKVNNITSFISKLIELDVLEKIIPITENNPLKSKKGLYYIKDNFLLFWFRFVVVYENYLEIEKIDYVVEKIKNSFKNYVSFIFENICNNLIFYINLPFKILKSGRWWDNKNEIDIVAICENDEILFGECKWWENPVGLNILNELKEKSKTILKNNEFKKIYYIIFSKKGFTEELIKFSKKNSNILLFDMERLKHGIDL